MGDFIGFEFTDPGGAADFEFCLDGFEPTSTVEPTESTIYTRPVVYTPQMVCYEHAEEFAANLVIDNEHETFAFVSGNFIFGNLIEALVATRRISVRRMSIMTLSMSDENIDSIRNILEWMPVERLDIVLSDYWFSHERKRGGLVDYLFDELDIEGVDLHVAFAGTHAKVWCIETMAGNKLTMEGSANLRSSGNIEQFHISPDAGLFEFCDGMIQRIVEVYDIVNQDARSPKSVRRGKLWQAVAKAAVAVDAGAAAHAAGAAARTCSATGNAINSIPISRSNE